MWLSDSTPNEEIGFRVIKYVTKVCEEHNMNIKDTMEQIKNNLKYNDIEI